MHHVQRLQIHMDEVSGVQCSDRLSELPEYDHHFRQAQAQTQRRPLLEVIVQSIIPELHDDVANMRASRVLGGDLRVIEEVNEKSVGVSQIFAVFWPLRHDDLPKVSVDRDLPPEALEEVGLRLAVLRVVLVDQLHLGIRLHRHDSGRPRVHAPANCAKAALAEEIWWMHGVLAQDQLRFTVPAAGVFHKYGCGLLHRRRRLAESAGADVKRLLFATTSAARGHLSAHALDFLLKAQGAQLEFRSGGPQLKLRSHSAQLQLCTNSADLDFHDFRHGLATRVGGRGPGCLLFHLAPELFEILLERSRLLRLITLAFLVLPAHSEHLMQVVFQAPRASEEHALQHVQVLPGRVVCMLALAHGAPRRHDDSDARTRGMAGGTSLANS
mmetsp:Transcript_117628/g.332768  ORF Transcript_117628/g.332768 Transcript_117628/m.332768 type:complete len:384 (+) Transcript_117628:884-2035(+)